MRFELIPWISISGQIMMQIFVICTLIYMLWRYKRDSLLVFLVLLFFPRVFIFMGKNVENLYKVSLLLMCLYTCWERKVWKTYTTNDLGYLLAFIVLSAAFFYSTFFYSHDSITIIFSQYARYLEIFLLWFLLNDAIFYRNQKDYILKFLYEIVLVQVIISIFKLLVFQTQIEGLVGSFTIGGGGVGTSFPIIGFYIIYVYRRGQLQKMDWWLIVGLFLFGWTTGKRAVWIILPIIIMLFFSYVRGVRLNKYMILGLLAFPIMIYFGARLTPSLNPEHQVWGSFDLQHVWDYANKYQFGEEGIEGQRENIQESQQVTYDGGAYGLQNEQIEAYGRGNATIELFKLILGPRSLTEQDIWGTGLSSFYSTTYEEFDKLPLTIHLGYKGAGTGFFQMYATIGVVGAILMAIFSLIPYFRIKHRRIKWVMMVFFLYDYFMYNATTCRDTYLVAMIFICIFSVNYEYLKAKFHRCQMIQDSIKYQPHNLGYPKQAKNNPAE